ncbi:hypothetical protein PENANT_c001G03018 [Penicillium antarcticum]|uniref:AMP-dependent synthetase/ligase domain-containing protein n=1 Tax=Penicillium antarcticum TaxID=416450 RepID=A0A1V6QN40_9EURO|nr:hypothetical protein PENANT_c001G03018 [Penicillium antarcticum]
MDAIGGDKITAMLAADGGFPNDNIFNPLLSLAREVKHTIYYDPEAGLNTTYENFITDMIYVRHDLKMQLSAHLNADGALLEERSLVCFLAPASYDLAVAAFAVLALGGTIVPLFFNLKREKAQLIIEIGVPITAVYPEEEEYDEQRCIGKQLFTDMPVKLSNGGHGEILTINLHIVWVLMKTLICNAGDTVSILKLEEALDGLCCSEEAYVVPVQDQKLAEQAGALVRFVSQDHILQQLRNHFGLSCPSCNDSHCIAGLAGRRYIAQNA